MSRSGGRGQGSVAVRTAGGSVLKIRRKRPRGGVKEDKLDPEEYFCQRLVAALTEEEVKQLERKERRLLAGELEPDQAESELAERLRRDWERVHELAQRVVRMNPGRTDNHVSLGMCLERLGRRDEAAAAYREAIPLEPEEDGFRRLLEMALEEPARRKAERWVKRLLRG